MIIKRVETASGPMAIIAVSEGRPVFNEVHKGIYEKPVVDTILEHGPCETFLDLGAAFGFYTRFMLDKAREIIAFEPDPIRAGVFRWNMIGHDTRCATLHEAAISDVPVFHRMNDPGNMVHSGDKPKFTSQHPVAIMPLDHFADRDGPIIVKMDIEGGEIAALRSGRQILERHDVLWIIEHHGGAADITEALDGLNVERLGPRWIKAAR